jgi:hypothetical protein
MKLKQTVFLFIISAFFFVSCSDKEDSPAAPDIKSQISVNRVSSFIDDENNESIELAGLIVDYPAPKFEYVKINNFECSQDLLEKHKESVIISELEYSIPPIKSNSNTINFELKTESCLQKCTILKPKDIKNIKTSAENDMMEKDTDLEISLNGSDADAFIILFSYVYEGKSGIIEKTIIDEMLLDSTYTIDKEVFKYDGIINRIRAYPINGITANAKKDIIGNVCGDGSGYLLYQGTPITYENQIIVGKGGNFNSIQEPKPSTDEDLDIKEFKKILFK